jgi:hypothetical protein
VTTSLSVDLGLKLDMKYVESTDMNARRAHFVKNFVDAMTDGTATAQSDLLWWDTRTLAATSEDLDLAGVLLDPLSQAAMTFAEITCIFIENTSTTSTEIVSVGGATDNQFVNWVANASDIVNIGPKGNMLLWNPIDGYAVTGGTGDLLKIDSGADTVTYNIVLIGRSA